MLNQKIQAYITNSAGHLNSSELATAFQVNPNEFAFQLNKFLRADLASPAMENYLREMDATFKNKELPENLTVYRACNYLEMLPTMMSGNYMERGYMSTSIDKKVIMRFFNGGGYYIPAYLQIDLPKGTPVLFLDHIAGLSNDTCESEVLIGRKSAFRIEDELKLIAGQKAPEEFQGIVTRFKEMILIKLKFLQYVCG